MHRSPKFLRRIFPARTWGISVSERVVYLTFDDGPIPELTPWIIDYLSKEDIKATFFCVGENVRKHPEIFSQLLEAGHRVGNHTMQHQNGMKTEQLSYFKSIQQANQLIQSNLFRPPYGRLNKLWDQEIRKKYKIIMWSWLSKDYDNTVSTEKIIAESKNIRRGDILVFHDNKKTVERLKTILPPIINDLKKRGFRFEVIS